MIKLGTSIITLPTGAVKVYVGDNLVWPVVDHDLIIITRNDYVIGWDNANQDNIEVGYRRKGLPDGYTECLYNDIAGGTEGTTGWKTNNTSIIEARIYRAAAPASAFYMWRSDYAPSAGNARFQATMGASAGTWRAGSGTAAVNTVDIVGAPVTLRQDATGAYVDNSLYAAYSSPTITTSSNSLKWGTSGSDLRYYYFFHIRDGILRTFYIPCTRDSDGASGFYNLASDVFIEMGTAGPAKFK